MTCIKQRLPPGSHRLAQVIPQLPEVRVPPPTAAPPAAPESAGKTATASRALAVATDNSRAGGLHFVRRLLVRRLLVRRLRRRGTRRHRARERRAGVARQARREYLVNRCGWRTGQKRVTGGRWRRTVLVPPAAADYNQAPHETQMLGSRMNQLSISVLRVLPLPHVTRSYLARHNCSFVAS